MGYENLEHALRDEDVSISAVIGEISCLVSELNPLEKMIVELSIVGYNTDELSNLIGLSRTGITRRRIKAFEKMREKMVQQKELLKMVFGRDASLREIIEYAG
jgi:RNA polymerase sigma-70 factor (ECF subfamily)